jgi:hypothetical protein
MFIAATGQNSSDSTVSLHMAILNKRRSIGYLDQSTREILV